jgi:hypothetical protein
MRLVAAILVAAAAAGSASAAHGQHVVPRAPVIAEFGACVVRQSADLARELMATEIGSRRESDLAHQLVHGRRSCLDGRAVLTFHTGEVRGTVAEALLERDPEAISHLRGLPARTATRAVAAEGRAFVAGLATCLADADPARSAQLLATEPHSAEERGAFLSFGTTLNDCMPLGFSYRMDRFDVRNHIAARLYQIAHSTADPAPNRAGAE